MNRQRALVLVLLAVAAVVIAVLVLLPRLGGPKPLTGYVEGEALYFAAPTSGRVDQMLVVRGQEVKAGQKLFVVDTAQVDAQRGQASADVAAAEAQALDARKGLRPVELAVLEANIAAAEARARDANSLLRRVDVLARRGYYAQARLDEARANAQAANAQA
ncbi:MAG: biotin/lipoyl-binding protein, partial [Phenylobacterium sp.]